MNRDEILKLVEAGYTKAEIDAMNQPASETTSEETTSEETNEEATEETIEESITPEASKPSNNLDQLFEKSMIELEEKIMKVLQKQNLLNDKN